ncbi:MAG: hypothetical protein ACT4P9_05400 [Betaproteobacteria bacterium]
MSAENETLRWPTNLDHAAIVRRLVEVRTAARMAGLPDLAERFADVESMPAGKLASRVVAALTSIQEIPEHRALAMELEMVAMNLKNLR